MGESHMDMCPGPSDSYESTEELRSVLQIIIIIAEYEKEVQGVSLGIYLSTGQSHGAILN